MRQGGSFTFKIQIEINKNINQMLCSRINGKKSICAVWQNPDPPLSIHQGTAEHTSSEPSEKLTLTLTASSH